MIEKYYIDVIFSLVESLVCLWNGGDWSSMYSSLEMETSRTVGPLNVSTGAVSHTLYFNASQCGLTWPHVVRAENIKVWDSGALPFFHLKFNII